MSASSLLTFIAAMIAINLSPGPGMAAIIGATLSDGKRAGFAVFTGALLGDFIWFFAAIAGAGAAAFAIGPWLNVLTILAGGYLVWRGTAPFRVRSPAPVPISESVPPARLRSGNSFVSGLFITLGNPGVGIFFLAILPSVTDLTHLSRADIALLSALLILSSVIVYAVIIGIAALTRRHILIGGHSVLAGRMTGALLVIAGLWLIWTAASTMIEHPQWP